MNPLHATNSNLDDESLAMLLEEVSAMAASGRSLVSGLSGLDDAAMGGLGRAAGVVRSRIEQGQPTAEAIAALSQTYQVPIRAAMELMADTGSTAPIYEAVRLIREANDHRRQITLAAINPMLNIIVAATIMFFVMPWILVSISEAELIKPAFAPSVTEIGQTFARNFFLAATVTVVVIGCFAIVLYWFLTRSLRGLEVSRDHSTFCRWLAMQVDAGDSTGGESVAGSHAVVFSPSGVEVGKAIETAAKVVSTEFAMPWQVVVENVHRGSQTSASLAMPVATPEPVKQCVVDLVAARRKPESVAQDLRSLSDLYQQTSRRRRTWWVEVLPRWVTAIMMIVMMMILLQAILVPLLNVVGEVAG